MSFARDTVRLGRHWYISMYVVHDTSPDITLGLACKCGLGFFFFLPQWGDIRIQSYVSGWTRRYVRFESYTMYLGSVYTDNRTEGIHQESKMRRYPIVLHCPKVPFKGVRNYETLARIEGSSRRVQIGYMVQMFGEFIILSIPNDWPLFGLLQVDLGTMAVFDFCCSSRPQVQSHEHEPCG